MRRVLQGRPVVYQQVDPMYRGGRVLRSKLSRGKFDDGVS